MIGRNRRGIRGASVRTRLAVAAAVLVGGGTAGAAVLAGGGAAGAAALAVSHSGATAAQSAGDYPHDHGRLSEPHALSSAMNGWSHSPERSLYTLSRMTPMRTFHTTAWHRHILVIQRGTVVAAAETRVAIRSTNGTLELWQLNRNTKIRNVGGERTGMAAMTGGTLPAPGRMNALAKAIAPGDLVFIFGERENTTLKAQLVLFAMPVKPAPTMTTVTPTAAPARVTTPSITATPSMTTTPVPTSTVPTFSGNNS